MADEDITWSQPDAPPPPLFLGKKERDLVKQVNDEIIEQVVGQQIIYYPISQRHTQYHPLYGEAVEKSFLAPVHIYALVNWGEGIQTTTQKFGLDKESKITIGFHKRRLTEDQDLYAREGDFVCYGDRYYEIVKIGEPRELFGQADHRFELAAICIRAREGLFVHEEPATLTRARRVVESTPTGTGTTIVNNIISVPSSSVSIFCATASSPDATALQDLADNPSSYFGRVIYVSKISPENTIYPFTQPGKFYFNENGTWYPSPFLISPSSSSPDNC